MSEPYKVTIATLQEELAQQEAAVLETKRVINMLCKRAGMTPLYSDTELGAASGPSLSIRSDQFYGQPLATVLRTILEMRKARDQGPATVNELYDAMIEGGFAFDTKDPENAKRNLRISISKNSTLFHRLPTSGRIGLLEWYPNAKQPKAPKKGANEDDDADDDSAKEDA